jgi:hypothetical protein
LSPRILELRGRHAAARGDPKTADKLLREALELYRAIGATGHAARLARALAKETTKVTKKGGSRPAALHSAGG